MAQNKVVIDVEARFIDNVTGKANKVDKTIDNLGKKKPKVVLDADTGNADGKLDKTNKKLDEFGKKNKKANVGVEDNASKKLVGILDKAKMLADKVYTAAVKIRDNEALNKLSKIEEKARSLAGKAWTAVIKVKDLATAPLKTLYKSIFNIKTLIAGVLTGMAAKQFLLNPINLADQYSSAKIGFSTLLGEKQGQEMMNEIDAFAKATPFKTSGVISNVQKMMAYGWDVNRVIKDMKTIGDAAAATGKGDQGLESIVYALSEIRSKGKLSTQELNQLASAGIKAKAYLAEGLGYGSSDEGMAALAKDLEKGAIGANQAIDLILEGMKEFEGMMDKTANETVEGLKSQLEDTFEINIARRWGQGLQDGAKRGLGYIVSLLDEADEALVSFGDTIYDVGKELSNYFADVLGNTVSRIKEITESGAFKNASLGEKISMLWEGAIANPFADWWSRTVVPWWDSTAVPWLSKKAAALGETIGTGLSAGLLALFGASDEAMNVAGQGASIAASFVKGFVDGFDGSAVAGAIADAISGAWDAMPAPIKLLLGGMAVSKGAGMLTSLAGGVATLAGGASKFLGGAAAGTGLLGLGTNTAIAMGAGNLAGGASAGVGALSALGLGGIAGGVAGGVSAISGGIDLYRGFKDKNLQAGEGTMSKAYKVSGASKLAGVGGGALAGAAIGSFIPVIGTGIGALIGAGIGGIAGAKAGKNSKKEFAESIKTMGELETAAKSSSEAAAVLEERQAGIAEQIDKRFGNVVLSMQEIDKLVTGALGNMSEDMVKFQSATADAEGSLNAMASNAESLSKWNWKASLGYEFTKDDKQNYKSTVKAYIQNAEDVIENEHYKFTAAVDMLLETKAPYKDDGTAANIIKNGDAFFQGMQEELNANAKELNLKVKAALKDGSIDIDEQEAITTLQNKIQEITSKVSTAQSEAKMEALKIKFSTGKMDFSSFQTLQSELAAELGNRQLVYDDALVASISKLKLQYPEGGNAYQEAVDNLINGTESSKGYKAQIDDLNAEVTGLQLEIIGDNFADVLGEDAKAKLQSALNTAMTEGIDPISWSPDQLATMLNTPALAENANTAIADTLTQMLSSVASTTGQPLDIAAVQVAGGDTLSATARKEGESAVSRAFSSPFSTTATINATAHVNWKISNPKPNLNTNVSGGFRGGAIYPSDRHVARFGSGGQVQGGAQLIMVAEEGDPEMIIPLGSQRRKRGLQLWEQAGHMMGVPGFANGGMVGGGSDEGLRFQNTGGGSASGAGGINVNVGGVTVEVKVDGSGGNPDIAAAIAEQGGEIAEQIAGILADAFNSQFENTPTKGVA